LASAVRRSTITDPKSVEELLFDDVLRQERETELHGQGTASVVFPDPGCTEYETDALHAVPSSTSDRRKSERSARDSFRRSVKPMSNGVP
jgi:hypothetical protein